LFLYTQHSPIFEKIISDLTSIINCKKRFKAPAGRSIFISVTTDNIFFYRINGLVAAFGWTKLERKISSSAVGDFKSIILDYFIIFT
jgi:hypothetical protein